MMTRTLLARCAPLAIAASVALPAIPAVAQDATAAQPAIVLPETPPPAPVVAAPAQPAPTIVLPEAVEAPAAPVVTRTAPEPRVATPRRAAPAADVSRATPAAPDPVVASQPAEAVPAQAAPALTAEQAAVAMAPVAAQPPVAEPMPTTAATNDTTDELALAGLLAALGLAAVGGVAFAATRRSRRNRAVDAVTYDEPVYDTTPEVAVAPEPVAARTVDVAPVPAFATSAPVASAFATPVVAPAAAQRAPLRANGDPVPLPAQIPATFEERDALLKELVAAEPDKANPFTSPRARARRAKLIIQSLGRNFSSRKPRIDLSEYTNRWPSLRGWQPATA